MSANRASVLTVCLLAMSALPLAAQEAAAGPEQFRGRIFDAANTLPRASTAYVTIHIDRYSTAEEIQQLAGILVEKGPDALVDALHESEIGWIRVGNLLSYPLSAARSIPTDNGRVVRVVTDRPIQMFESWRGLRSLDYTLGIAELKLDAEGKGEGTLIAAGKAELKEGTLEIESLGIQPFRLMNIKLDKKKKK